MKNKLVIGDVKSFTHWSEGTVGYAKEEAALKKLLQIANEIGYGRLVQLSEKIRDKIDRI